MGGTDWRRRSRKVEARFDGGFEGGRVGGLFEPRILILDPLECFYFDLDDCWRKSSIWRF